MRKRFTKFQSLALFCFCFCWAALSVVTGQSLSDLAKEEKDRRAGIKNKVRVISNSSIGSYKKGSISTGVYGDTGGDEVKSASGEAKEEGKEKTPAEPVKDEAYWRNAYKTALDEAKAAENKSVLEQLNLNELWNQFYRQDDGFYRETIRKNITTKEEDIKKAKAAEEEAKKALERFKEEARKNNVAPGWLR